jgi:hypothetical protein
MGWKELSYWLRGGIIALIVYMPIFAWGLNGDLLAGGEGCWGFCMALAELPAIVIISLLFDGAKLRELIGTWGIVILGFLLTALVYFAIGALIGWIVGKIKNKS